MMRNIFAILLIASLQTRFGSCNNAPVANDDYYTTLQTIAIQTHPVDNDVDADGQSLSISTVGSPTNGGSRTWNGNVVTYTPSLATCANTPSLTQYQDTIPYTIEDTGGLTATATIIIVILCDRTTPSPTAPTFAPVASPVCPSGYSQDQDIGYRADIIGCGLEGCNARYQDNYSDINACAVGCDGRSDCKAFSWAPFNDDWHHSGKTVCTLYNTDTPTGTWGRGQQVFCKK